MVHPDNISKQVVSSNEVSLNVQRIVVKAVDVRNEFNNKQEFKNRDNMLKWIRMVASRLGFGVVIERSDNCSNRRSVFITMLCERSGKYRIPLQKFKREDTGSRKCECPFKLCGYMLARKKRRFNVICGVHNHELCLKLVGHPSACQFKPEEKICISDMTLNLVQPKNILATLKRKQVDNISNIKQVYNIRNLTNKVIRGDRTEMQQLLKLLDGNNYVSRYRTCDDGVTVRDIIWTHLGSVKLFNMFSTVLILDSTYKTNKYKLLLFEMVGVTSTEKTYSVGFAFLECEKEDNFTWALEVCRSLLKDQGAMPKNIVTDCDTALMNAVAKVFPSSYVLLCKYHITKNVRSWIKLMVGTKQVESEGGKLVKSGVIVKKIMDAWNRIINSSTKELYADSVIHFRKVCEKYKENNYLVFLNSLSYDSVLKMYQEKFRRCISKSDMIDEIHYLLPYGDTRRVVMFEYRSPLVDNEWNIVFNKFELKTQADVMAMWRTFFDFKEKVPFELEATLRRSVDDILEMCKRPPEY